MEFKIIKSGTINTIPSASGVVVHDNFYYVIGDDSPHLFKLDSDFNIVDQFSIFNLVHDFRIPKGEKPDFEALELLGDNKIIGFGSGSKSPQRDEFFCYDFVERAIERYNVTSFYDVLKGMEILKDSELNIEAAAYTGEILYLFNRRKNIVFSLHYPDFLNYLKGGFSVPDVYSQIFSLPMINNVEAGFSGATINRKGDMMVITASVENTDNAYDDGVVFGSFIGIVPIKEGRPLQKVIWTSVQGFETPIKIESVSIEREIGEQNFNLVLTTDSDGGDSLFIKGNLSW